MSSMISSMSSTAVPGMAQPRSAALTNPESTQNYSGENCGKQVGKLKPDELVRWKGFEPSRYCYRQPLKLVRLPVPPPPQSRCNFNCTRRASEVTPLLIILRLQPPMQQKVRPPQLREVATTVSSEPALERLEQDSAAKARGNSASRPVANPRELRAWPQVCSQASMNCK